MPRLETVIFALIKDNQVLCERRFYQGEVRNCIPGGGVEEVDHSAENYVQAAAEREANEELNANVRSWKLLGEFMLDEKKVSVLSSEEWTGEIPAHNRDNGNELQWVDLHELIPTVVHPPLKKMLEAIQTSDC